MYRLFVAIDLPGSVRAQLADLGRELDGVRRVPPDQLHLTLRFIGNADDECFQRIKDSMATVTSPPFTLALAGVGCFPSPRRPRVIWAGVTADERLTLLQRAVETAVAAAGIPPEERPFSPHITLARLKDAIPEGFSAFQSRHGEFRAEPFAVEEFLLYSSTLTAGGALHRREASYRLTG
ncbi:MULTISPECIES: RNA 2',3'-cyclic phosphodiesterase [Geobacter]|uniref:RNA 2',3'-cyclic phosphodiesterase n=1 Tax=Geobacter TaxID=28231 RepID=UPI002573984A|nr:RNA 2',3'-cyclic phosphodiesterase [Geobacter sulfurreducens]BEH08424.1 RNA 2',3'-cyclic phosphodiesterase [Geobacter sulfurreducens subsp. ethanolicus]BET59903.1 RNA 2',3'-cyclic phosphodiesterase [Geobacter sp. 60473]HML77310.1 RNA 2',3'-cyclic phosphodiesterase [Geobacter sulfurreducens]